ncbi:hypothetical protein [Klebsiella phage KP-PHA-Meh]|uniref:Uncharacterized protein n=1 Tax=Klebsiella phage KA TaxID=3109000 RepID=A0ABZ1A1S3_9CAUD|nr:hypothetical protein [Klebsiella phage KA]WQZ03125.1 hypothetical protein [Klebsiella phage KP-PHA-Meh]
MYKFKVGDKVVRTVESPAFRLIQGVKEYYIVTDVGTGGYWLQLDGVRDKEDPRPWYWNNFELYQEPGDDELPPVPSSVSYLNTKRDRGNDQRLVLEKDNGDGEGLMYIGVVPKKGSTRAKVEIGINIDPDSALQLAHDLRRMAMEIKRKEKAQ